MRDEKKALREYQVLTLSVPHYEELSVRNMYKDAILDPEVAIYLPSLEQNSGKLPERSFFFGILATVKGDYLKQVIADAHKVRMKSEDSQRGSSAIVLKDAWLEELRKYPFISSKDNHLPYQKRGTGIFLMKERSKLVRQKKNQTKHQLSSRLINPLDKEEEMKIDQQNITKRRKEDEKGFPVQAISVKTPAKPQ